jgi:hypothetical protein
MTRMASEMTCTRGSPLLPLPMLEVATAVRSVVLAAAQHGLSSENLEEAAARRGGLGWWAGAEEQQKRCERAIVYGTGGKAAGIMRIAQPCCVLWPCRGSIPAESGGAHLLCAITQRDCRDTTAGRPAQPADRRLLEARISLFF